MSPFCSMKFGKLERQKLWRAAKSTKRLRRAVDVEDGLQAVARPLRRPRGAHAGLFERAHVVDEHGVEDALLFGGEGAVAGVEVAGGALVLKDDRSTAPRREFDLRWARPGVKVSESIRLESVG